MADRAALRQIALRVAGEMTRGVPGEGTFAAREYLERQPEAAIDLIDQLAEASTDDPPDEALVSAYLHLLGAALETIRYRVDNREKRGVQLAEAARRKAEAVAEAGEIAPIAVAMMVQQFAEAKLEPGEALRNLVVEAMGEDAADDEELEDLPGGMPDVPELLEALADAAGGDAFALHAQMSTVIGTLPTEHRAHMVGEMIRSPVPLLREAALGWLLDPAEAVRTTAADAFAAAAAAGGVTGVMLRRLAALRAWVPEAGRAALDRALAAAHAAKVAPAPWPEARIREIAATAVDGSGSQSFFAFAQERRKSALACLLLKRDFGVRDAWTRHGMTRREADEFLGEVEEEMDVFTVDAAHLRLAVAHFLAENLAAGALPPFAMLDVAETAGLGAIAPETLPLDRLMAQLASGDHDLLGRDVTLALAQGQDLADDYAFVASWFEEGDEVDALLGRGDAPREAQIAAVRDRLLPARREKWAQTFAWTALTLRHDEDDHPWEAFHVAARELLAGRPIAEIPLMAHIAEATVDAFAAQREG